MIPNENPLLDLAATRAGLRSVLRRPELGAAARALARRGAKGWIVGGAARDILLGLPVPDVDLAVSADPWEIADELSAAGFGTAVPLSDAAPRVARVSGRRELDLARIEGGGIREDLARRDFTVNAIAIELADGGWIDPFGGVRDLARRRIRMLSEANLRDDPLRTLRAARLMATRGLSPDPATTAASRRVAPALSSAAPERIRSELEKLLASPHAIPALAWAARTRLLGPALGLEEAAALTGQRLRRTGIDALAIRRRPPAERLRLRLVLLASALRLSPGDAAAWLSSRRFSRATAGETSALLRLARDASQPSEAARRWWWVRDAEKRAEEALLLARILFPARRPAVEAHARAASSRRKPPRVTGEDILAWLAIPPGPRVGQLLREVEVAGLRGQVRTRREARRWLREEFRRDPSAPAGPPPGLREGEKTRSRTALRGRSGPRTAAGL